MPLIWHITGANSGLGLCLALQALAQGDSVIAAVRRPDSLPKEFTSAGSRAKIIYLDLTWTQEEMDTYATKAFALFGRIDIVVNNAGYAYIGSIEESTDKEVKSQFDINVFANLRLLRSFLPKLRAQTPLPKPDIPENAIIMTLSSLAGIRSSPSTGIYAATKFALEALNESLGIELEPFGIHCVAVEPGLFRTNFLGPISSGENIAPAHPAYRDTAASASREGLLGSHAKQLGNPEEGAKRMWEYVYARGMFEGKKRTGRLPLGSDSNDVFRAVAGELVEAADYYRDVSKSTDYKD